ncbi:MULTISPECIES: type IV pilus modification protein PilV [Marinobacter]|uniref:Type IV pilus modification protein PilV n=1 Tax=Marinobacter metalliresistant TaxID=2961995 RepID=A0ABZ2W022_9GAMM|nr:type IV pilus modification protein PilV [Marinobacter sp. Arc7-DN-1]
MMKTSFIPKRGANRSEMKGMKSQGFTLIEILVTVFILAIGLLGLAGLLVDGMRNNQGAYLRTQASILAYDMADRIRANRAQAVGGGAYDGFTTVGASTNLPVCATQNGGCSPAQQVTVDLAQWARQIQGVGSDMTLLPGGQGSIQFDAGTEMFTISVQWDEVVREGDANEQIAGDNSFFLNFSL